MQTVQELTEKLSNFYWSPNHPSTYVLRYPEDTSFGLGKIAHLDYAAFNLTWAATKGVLNTPAEHMKACEFFRGAHTFVNQVTLQGEKLETWLTLLTQEQFFALVEANKDTIKSYEMAVFEVCL